MSTADQLSVTNEQLLAAVNAATDKLELLASTNRALNVYGLARNSARVSNGTYNATEIVGYRVLDPGSGTLTVSPVGGAPDTVFTNAEVVYAGPGERWEHLDSLTTGVGMAVLVYIP